MSSNKQHILVTGGAGFLGSHIVDRALRQGFQVTSIDNLYTGSRENFQCHLDNPHFHFIQHNIQFPLPPDICYKYKYSYIFHMACPASPPHYQNDPIGTCLTCINGTLNALKLATEHNCPVLIGSTSEVYGDPEVHPQPETYVGHVNCTGIRSCYDEGKRCAEALCFDFHRQYGTKVRVARIFNTYGPRMCFNDGRMVTNFLVQALEGCDITVYGDGTYTRSFQYVDDLIEGFWRLIHHPTETGPVNLGNPQEYSVYDMAKKIVQMVPQCKSKIVFLPNVQDDPQRRKADITKAKKVLHWQPTICVKDGLKRTFVEFKARMDKKKSACKAIHSSF